MKVLIFLGIFAVIGWTSFYDVTKGTLNFISPTQATQQPVTKNTQAASEPYKTVQIAPGDTVLSIHEKMNPNAHVTIQTVLSDFKSLNKGVDPNHIQIGKNYKFPLYSSQK